VQEEPKNRGAWNFMSDRLQPMLPETAVLNYFGREESASPAVGSKKINDQEEAEIISRALDLPAPEPAKPTPVETKATDDPKIAEKTLEKIAHGSGVGGD